MKITNNDKYQIKQKQTAEKTISIINTNKNSTAENCCAKNLYYKDFFLDKNYLLSFKGNNIKPVQNKEQLYSSIQSLNKYTNDEIKEIMNMPAKILENDYYEEVEEPVLYEMFDTLTKSSINYDIDTLREITSSICKLEQDEENEIDLNSIFMGITAVADALPANHYKFKNIFIGYLDGFLNCENSELVQKFSRLINSSFKDVDTEKFIQLINIYHQNIAQNDENLYQAFSDIKFLKEKYHYTNQDLLDGLMIHYRDKTPLEETPKNLQEKIVVNNIYNKLKVENLPDKNQFEDIFTVPILILKKRGYSDEEIITKLSGQNFCNKIMEIECIIDSDKEFLANFVENIEHNINFEDILSLYTESSKIFNDILYKTDGNLSYIDDNLVFTNEKGKIFGANEVKNLIKEMENIIRKNKLHKNTTVYRGSGTSSLDQLKMPDGENLGSELKEAMNSKNKEKITEIVAELIGACVTHLSFMSTSCSKNLAKSFVNHEGGVLWEIKAPKGTNAIYMDPFNKEHGIEHELLFNRGCTLLINDAKMENDIFVIHADLIKALPDNHL